MRNLNNNFKHGSTSLKIKVKSPFIVSFYRYIVYKIAIVTLTVYHPVYGKDGNLHSNVLSSPKENN